MIINFAKLQDTLSANPLHNLIKLSPTIFVFLIHFVNNRFNMFHTVVTTFFASLIDIMIIISTETHTYSLIIIYYNDIIFLRNLKKKSREFLIISEDLFSNIFCDCIFLNLLKIYPWKE